MSSLAALKAIADLKGLAGLLGIKPSALAYLIYELPDPAKYTTFTISKRSGGTRTISAPDKRLKLVQRRLAELLEKCQFEVDKIEGVEAACIVAHSHSQR